ncbi:hypothetical protein CERZMDRAFT_88309 [Cercospora zeae-maydis SCOH1-5]|uniref:Uncharacterized protein n=1 Tax=Cercospora zeae-maydis SCOH1-5 TaxID=717836 RepID=A0A6A6F343_9PEZI|nr:hypothetical protein CERZMDRAFT_88309 [Cercospora zeae-maydis SCOH1-5]
MSSSRSVQRCCLFCKASVLLRRCIPPLPLLVGRSAESRPIHTSRKPDGPREEKRRLQHNLRGSYVIRAHEEYGLNKSERFDGAKKTKPELNKHEKPRRNKEASSSSSRAPRTNTQDAHTQSTPGPRPKQKPREQWAKHLGITRRQELAFNEIKDIWERLASAKIVYGKKTPVTMPDVSGVGEVKDAKQVKEECLAAAAKVGASKVLQWLRTIRSLPKLDQLMTMSGGMWQPLAWHVEAERLMESFHNAGTLPPSPMEDWVLEVQAIPVRASRKGPFITPERMPLAHLKAALYWHESPDTAIDFVCRLPLKELVGRLCMSYEMREPCVQQDSYDRFLGLELTHWQRAVAMLWHPTNPDALTFTTLYTEMLQRKKDSKERKQTNRQPGILLEAPAFVLDIPRAEYILRLQGQEEEINKLKTLMPVSAKAINALIQRQNLFQKFRKDPRLEKLHAQSPHLEHMSHKDSVEAESLRVETKGERGMDKIEAAEEQAKKEGRVKEAESAKKPANRERRTDKTEPVETGEKAKKSARHRECSNEPGAGVV